MTGAPIACTLTEEDLQERLAWIATLSRDALRSHVRDGRTLHLTYDAAAADRVRDMIRREASCCAFLAFDLHESHDGIRLTITAPTEAGDDVETLLQYFVPPASRTGGCSC